MENKKIKEQNNTVEKKGRIIKGMVVSDKMNKTVVVAVLSLKEHPKYRKRYKSTKRYKAHDENNEYKIGEKVLIQECRPISKDKRWKIVGRV
jgi:small subunit ribosomal protein S17